jgi:uncharacterized protein (TIGR02099 family)
MAGLMGKLLRTLVYTAATVVIALALLIGLVRLLLPILPDYQQQVRDAAAVATGFDVDFSRLSASWPLRGPELVLYEVEILDPQSEGLVAQAREVSVGIDVLRLLLERRLVPSSIGLTGVDVLIERLADGSITVQGRRLADWFPVATDETPAELPRLSVRLEDIELRYIDPAANPGETLQARLPRLGLDIGTNELVAEGVLELRGTYSGRIQLSADGQGRLLGPDADLADADWRVSIDAENLDIPPLVELALGMRTPMIAARGSLSLAGRVVAGRPRAGFIDLDLRGLEFRDGEELIEGVDVLAGRLEWEADTSGWLFGVTDLRVGRGGRSWPRADATIACRNNGDASGRECEGSASFLRLDDVYALIRGFASSRARADLLPEDFRGEVRDMRFTYGQDVGQAPRFELSLNFSDLGLINQPGRISVAGLTGEMEADQAGGRLELASGATEWMLPTLFEDALQTDSLSGLLVWRVADDGLRVLSDSVKVTTTDVTASSRFELNVPADGSSPFLDLDARARSDNAPGVLRYMPLRRFPPDVGKWLKRAIVAGRIEESSIRWRGPLRAFPYERGEGLFRADLVIADGLIDYADRWPRLEALNGDVVFDGVSLSSTRNQARIAGIAVTNGNVHFADLRSGLLHIGIDQPAALLPLRDMLLATPVADTLGGVLTRVRGQGNLDARLQLELPVKRPQDYRLEASFDAQQCDLGYEGLAFQLDQIHGIVKLRNTQLSAERLEAVLLGEPVQVQLRPAGKDALPYSHFALLSSRTPLRRWVETLELPKPERFSGDANWRALVMIPGTGPDGGLLKVKVTTDLEGVESRLPAPFAKAPGESAPLEVGLDFAGDELDVTGRLRDDVAWAFRLEHGADHWAIERGAIHSGYGPAVLPVLPGIELSGRLARLRLSEWLELASGDGTQSWFDLYREAALTVDDLVVFGQSFPDAEILATRQPGAWRVALDAPWVLGNVIVPDVPAAVRPLRLEMDRLWLLGSDTAGSEDESSDPRAVPPIALHVGDFRIGTLNFGSLDARVASTEEGILASPIQTKAPSFEITGDAAWRVVNGDVEQQRTRLRTELRSTKVKATLESLGYQPMIEGKSGRVNADLSWPGQPAADFLRRASGQVQIRLKDGALLEVEPGSGRMLGMLSVAALPRRLALDFRDVFDEGLSFDVLEGDFSLETGEAYTCNLGLQGGVADLGIVGRTSLRDESYDQLAVVRPHVSNVLALGGAVVGGPGVGAAMLLISRIFRKPLSQIGESYYEIQGSWAEPAIDKVQRTDVDTTRFSDCEALLPEILPEAVLVPLPKAAKTGAEPEITEDDRNTP